MILTITTLFFRGQFLDYVQEMLYVRKLLIILSLKQCVNIKKKKIIIKLDYIFVYKFLSGCFYNCFRISTDTEVINSMKWLNSILILISRLNCIN